MEKIRPIEVMNKMLEVITLQEKNKKELKDMKENPEKYRDKFHEILQRHLTDLEKMDKIGKEAESFLKWNRGMDIAKWLDELIINIVKDTGEKTQEESKPKYKVWNYAVYGEEWDEDYIKIFSVSIQNWKYIYNKSYHKNYQLFIKEEDLRYPTFSEKKYFR